MYDMHVCMHACVCRHAYVETLMKIKDHVIMCILCGCMYACICRDIDESKGSGDYVHVYVCTCIYMHACMCMCVHVYMYVDMHIQRH